MSSLYTQLITMTSLIWSDIMYVRCGCKWMSVANVRKRTSVRKLHLTSVNSYYLRRRLQSWHIPYTPTTMNISSNDTVRRRFNERVVDDTRSVNGDSDGDVDDTQSANGE